MGKQANATDGVTIELKTRVLTTHKSSLELLSEAQQRASKRGRRCLWLWILGFRGCTLLLLAEVIGFLLIYAHIKFESRPWYILVAGNVAVCVPLGFIYTSVP